MTTTTPALLEHAEMKVRRWSPQLDTMLLDAEECQIIVAEHYEQVGTKILAVKDLIKSLDVERKDITKGLDETKAKIIDRYRPSLDKLKEILAIYEGKFQAWKKEKERERQEEERAARDAAAKEQARLNAQAAKKAEKLEAKGDHDQAEAVRESVPQVAMPIVAPADVPKVKGLTTKEHWDWACVVCSKKDCAHMVKALSEAGALGYLSVNEVALNAAVTKQKELTTVPGGRVFPRDRMAGTGRR